MSNITEAISSTKGKFTELIKAHNAVAFEQECNNALFLLKQNSFLMDMASKNPESLKMAIYQMASVGLSLNPSKRHGYLVPYGGKNPRVTFMPGYCGLVHLAMTTGSIEWVSAEIVHDGDNFTYNGAGEKPTHSFDPFSEDRANMTTAKGVYCVAKTKDGAYLTEMMSRSEVYEIRKRSEAFKSGKNMGPWFSDEGEMWKKTVIRRAEKLWPKTERLSQAVEILNDNDATGAPVPASAEVTEKKLLLELIEKKEHDPKMLLQFLQIDSFNEIENADKTKVAHAINGLKTKKDKK